MSMILYGLKNLYRNKTRTLIVALLIALPFFALLMMNAVEGAINNQIDRIKENVGTLIHIRPSNSLGHVNQAGGLNKLLPSDAIDNIKSIENADNIVKVEQYLIAIEPIANYYMTLHTGVKIGDKKRLESHGEVGDPKIIKGRDFLSEDGGKDVAIVGKEYAQKVGIDVEKFDENTYFVKETLTPGPGLIKSNLKSIGGKQFKVVGIFDSGYNFGNNQLFLPYETFKKNYDIEEGISKIYVTVDSIDNVEKVATQLKVALGDDADIITAKQGSKFISVALGTMRVIARAWVVITIMLMVLIILFSMLLVTDERYKELGTLKAIGASTFDIGKQFITESIALTLIGGIVGLGLFRIIGSTIGAAFFKSTFYVYLPNQYGESLVENFVLNYGVSFSTLSLLMVISFIVGLIGSSYSIIKARKMSPMEAMHNG